MLGNHLGILLNAASNSVGPGQGLNFAFLMRFYVGTADCRLVVISVDFGARLHRFKSYLCHLEL